MMEINSFLNHVQFGLFVSFLAKVLLRKINISAHNFLETLHIYNFLCFKKKEKLHVKFCLKVNKMVIYF